MKQLLLIRHTTPDVEVGVCYGQLDLDVSDSFIREAQSIQDLIRYLKVDKVYSSPLIRCSKLATYLYPKQKATLDKCLMELNFGDWEGLIWSDIPKESMDAWAPNFLTQRPPNGETFSELLERLELFDNDNLSPSNEKIALITHSGIIRAFLMKYLNIPSKNIFNLHLNYGCVIQIDFKSDEYHQVKFLKG